jgi:hypothetical protein
MNTVQLVVGKTLRPSQSVLVDEDEKKFYWHMMLNMYNVKSKTKRNSPTFYPGCNPKSVSADHLSLVNSKEYVITLKSDGVRYSLMLSTRPNGDPIAIMIGRCRNMYEIEVLAPEDYFLKGTLLEGELVSSHKNDHFLFLAFDGIMIKGRDLTALPFKDRILEVDACVRYAEEIVEGEDQENKCLENDCICITHYSPKIILKGKTFIDKRHAEDLWKRRGGGECRTDGIIFYDMNAKYVSGAADSGNILKWKETASVDLLGAPPNLYTGDEKLPDKLNGMEVKLLPSKIIPKEGEIVEYIVSIEYGSVFLMAIRIRKDKTTANGLRIVMATLRDVENKLCLSSIC